MLKVISVEPFGAAFTLAVGTPALCRLSKKLKTPLDADSVRAAVYRIDADKEGTHMVMYLPEVREEELVWHEALHMATALLDIHGIEISLQNDEVLAYVQGSIVREVDKVAYRPRVNRTKRKSGLE